MVVLSTYFSRSGIGTGVAVDVSATCMFGVDVLTATGIGAEEAEGEQAVINNASKGMTRRMDIFYPFVYNPSVRLDSSMDRTRHS